MNREEIKAELTILREQGVDVGDLRASTEALRERLKWLGSKLAAEIREQDQEEQSDNDFDQTPMVDLINTSLQEQGSLLSCVPLGALKELFPDWEQLLDSSKEYPVPHGYYSHPLMGGIIYSNPDPSISSWAGDSLEDKLRARLTLWLDGYKNKELTNAEVHKWQHELIPGMVMVASLVDSRRFEFEFSVNGKEETNASQRIDAYTIPSESVYPVPQPVPVETIENIAHHTYLDWLEGLAKGIRYNDDGLWAAVALDYYGLEAPEDFQEFIAERRWAEHYAEPGSDEPWLPLLNAIKQAMPGVGTPKYVRDTELLAALPESGLCRASSFTEGWDDLTPFPAYSTQEWYAARKSGSHNSSLSAGLSREAALKCAKLGVWACAFGVDAPVIPLDKIEAHIGVARLALWLGESLSPSQSEAKRKAAG